MNLASLLPNGVTSAPAARPLHSRSLLLLRLVVRPSFSPTRAATLSLSLSFSPFHPLASPLLSSPLFSSHPLTALRRTSSSSFLLYSPAPSTVPLVPSSPFFLLSFLPVPTRHYLLSLAFVASPWQYRDDGRRGTESEKRKGPFSLALFPSMGRDNHWPVFFLSFLFFRALSSCTKDFLGFTLREIFSIDRGIAFTSRSLSRYLWRFIFPLYEREMMRVRMIEIDEIIITRGAASIFVSRAA